MCGIDPGIRTFQTIFNENEITTINVDKKKLNKLKNKLDLFVKLKLRNRYIYKIRTKMDNLINDMHWKTISYLTNNYDYIFMGKLDSQECAKKSKNKTLNRELTLFKHYEFRTKLRYVSIHKQNKLFIVKEHFTTKTCGKCGVLNEVGIKSVYNCNSCEYKTGRDVNASRNILMKGVITNSN